ncbi:hypothetical protein CXB51_031583 [Gossypium anomalum]|uniref:Reverse transcriptase Ty1/copia-type domain-containing protein n=1 Tax=Gossypium anomalum TaxID=47600 RepID=A0A8J5YCP0_9ROSI|nr:hypothetical protein CXB51_031583 [Gossypium anomalum]
MDYWGYAFYSVVHLISRLPTPVLKGQSLYQALHGHKPMYDHLRVLDCSCFPYLHPFVHHKVGFSFTTMYISRGRFLFPSPALATIQSCPCVTTYVPIVQPSSFRSTVVPSKTTMPSPAVPSPNAPRSDHREHRLSTPSAKASPFCLTTVSSNIPTVPPRINHTMVTRSKANIFKPKSLSVETIDFKPRTVEEALANKEWNLAVQAEFDALMANSTWELVPLPLDKKAPGCDFKETFSLVVKPATIQTILSIVVSNGWQLHQVDLNNAFLNGDLTNEVFMQQPPGYVQYGPNAEPLVCRLTKALYNYGKLHAPGIEVTQLSTGSFHLCQHKYIWDLLDKISLGNAKNVHTPIVSLLTELQISSTDPPTVWCDNSNAVAVAANPVLNSKFKHIKLDLFFVHKKVASGSLVVGEVPACGQAADILTKPFTSLSKKEEALENPCADSFLGAIGTFDGIIDIVSAQHPLFPLLGLLKSHEKLVLIGAPEKPLELHVFPLLQANHNVKPDIEVIAMKYVNITMEHLLQADVKYRSVINIENTLKATTS